MAGELFCFLGGCCVLALVLALSLLSLLFFRGCCALGRVTVLEVLLLLVARGGADLAVEGTLEGVLVVEVVEVEVEGNTRVGG